MVGRITANAVFLFLKLAHIVCAIGLVNADAGN